MKNNEKKHNENHNCNTHMYVLRIYITIAKKNNIYRVLQWLNASHAGGKTHVNVQKGH